MQTVASIRAEKNLAEGKAKRLERIDQRVKYYESRIKALKLDAITAIKQDYIATAICRLNEVRKLTNKIQSL